MKVLPRVFRYLERYPGLAFATLGCAMTSTLMVIVFPAVTQRIVDDVIRGGQTALLLPLILIGLGSFIAQDVLNGLRIMLNNTFEQKVIYDLRSDLYAHVQRLPLDWFDHRATGDVMTRLMEDVTSMERVLIDGIEQGVVAVLQILVVAVLMWFYSPILLLAAMIPLPFLIVGAVVFAGTAKQRYRRHRQASSALNALLHDNISGIRQIKTYASEEREHERFNETSNRLRYATLRMMKVWAIYNPGMNFLNSFGVLLVTGVGALRVMHAGMDIGVLVAFLVLTRFLYEPLGRLHFLNQIFQAGRAAGERVFEILDAELEKDEGTYTSEHPVKGEVIFEKVSFAYDKEKPTLQNVSFHAQPGEMVALVGPTGAGKTTIVSLLTRFYEAQSGRILIDGRELPTMQRAFLRENIAFVTQESFLFNGTVAENLRMGCAEASEERLWEVLEAANATEFVQRLPEQLHTSVGERGVRLSVGEKQRISIARALLKDPPILILDEATASVDMATERLIQEALDRLLVSRTSFVIAHRLSTVRHAHQILVLEHGQVVEHGRHDELLAKDGLYAGLCRLLDV